MCTVVVQVQTLHVATKTTTGCAHERGDQLRPHGAGPYPAISCWLQLGSDLHNGRVAAVYSRLGHLMALLLDFNYQFISNQPKLTICNTGTIVSLSVVMILPEPRFTFCSYFYEIDSKT